MTNNDRGITNELIDDILNDVKQILHLQGDDDLIPDMTQQEIIELVNTYL